jgi:4-amino-4-deoxy-L-arabinose transferase-like glycosyltransferase
MRKHLPIILLLVLSAGIYLATSFEPSIADDADGTHAVAAREILQRNDWVTLYVNGIRYLEKAPLMYWLVAVSYLCFGFNVFAVRFPIMVAVVLLAGVTYLFGRWAYSQKAGLYAAAILVSCVGMFLFTRIMIPEAILALWFTVAHLCFLRAFFGTGREKLYYYGFYAAIALAILTKGLIGIVLVASPAFFFLLLTGNLGRWKELRLFSGCAVFFAIAAPWHLLAGFQNKNFFWFYFINEHVLRFLSQRSQQDYNKMPFLAYWLLHLVCLFPWSLGFPLLLKQRLAFRSNADRQAQINLYLWLWAGIVLVFFNFSSNQEYYTFPAYPALALLLGAAFASVEVEGKVSRYLLWLNGVLVAIALFAAAILGVLVWNARQVLSTEDLSALIDQKTADSEQYTLFFGHFFDLTPQALAVLRVPALGAALTLGVGFLLAFWFRRQRQHGRATIAMLITMGLLFVCANRAHVKFEPILSSHALAEEIMQRWEPGAKIVINGNYEIGSSLGFYTNQQILLLNGRKLNLEFGSRYRDAPPIFLEYEDVRRLWSSPERVFLFTENAKKEAFLKNLGLPAIPVAEKGGKSLLTNQP